MIAAPTTHLDALFSALGDPTRRAIVARLARGDATVLELAEPFAVSLPAISRHLKVLEQAGLIARGRDAQRRPCRLRVGALQEISAWVDHTRSAWEQRFDRLESYLHELKQNETITESKSPSKRARKRDGRRNK